MKSSNKNSTPSESLEQATLVRWFDATYPNLKNRIFAIPNGGSRHKVEAMRLKMEGVRAGVPDLFLPVATGGKHGLFIEMKRSKGGRLSPEQKDWLAYLSAAGYQAHCCAGFDEARACIVSYLEETA